MERHMAKRFLVLALMASFIFNLAACATREPLPQPRRVADPTNTPGAVHAGAYDLAAVGYVYPGQGLNYAASGLFPVYLVFKNSGASQPKVDLREVRGVGADGEYLVYSLEEATRLVFASEAFKNAASNAARTGTVGAVLGAGLGALIGAIGGGDNLWKGAVIGGAAGAMAGGAYGAWDSEGEVKRITRDELRLYSWGDEPVPTSYTKVGYLYFPSDKGIASVRILVRDGDKVETFLLPVSQPDAVKK